MISVFCSIFPIWGLGVFVPATLDCTYFGVLIMKSFVQLLFISVVGRLLFCNNMCGGPEPRSTNNDKTFDLKEESKSASFAWKETTEKYCSALLELAANNDLIGFKQAIEESGSAIDEISFWYGRKIGSKKMGFEPRTPLMVAALYGSTDVVNYILCYYAMFGMDVNLQCGSDKVTAMHCAAAGGSKFSVQTIKLLLQASADVNILDFNGKSPADVIAVAPNNWDLKSSFEELLVTGCCQDKSAVSIGQPDSGKKDSVKVPHAQEDVNNHQSAIGGTNKLARLPSSKNCSENGTKKEYPVDSTLPDINNGYWSTDEFRMYFFKIKPCSRAYSHDWTECPFAHPGENAKRRDPRKHSYSCVPCPEFRKGSCRRGDSCEYAHGVFECWLHPAQYRTRMCKDETDCKRRVCFFAHKKEELRQMSIITGSAVSSPRVTSSMEMNSTLSPLTLGSSSTVYMPSTLSPNPKQGGLVTPPMSPSSSPAANSLPHSILCGGAWPQPNVPALNLPTGVIQGSQQTSRLRSSRNARDIALEELSPDYEEKLLNELNSLAKSRMGSVLNLGSGSGNAALLGSGKYWSNNNMGSVVTPTNLEDLFESELMLSPKVSASVYSQNPFTNQIQTPTSNHVSQVLNIKQGVSGSQVSSQLLSPVHSPRDFSRYGKLASLGVDLQHFSSDGCPVSSASGMNPRSAAAFALKEGRSFSSRDLGAHMQLPSLVDWGSPTGKADWGVHKNELHKLRKSVSFGLRSSTEADLTPVSLSESDNMVDVNDGCNVVDFSVDALKKRQAAGENIGTWLGPRHLDQQQMVA